MISGRSQVVGRVPTMEEVHDVMAEVDGRVDDLSAKVDAALSSDSIAELESRMEFIEKAQDRLLGLMLYDMKLQKALAVWLLVLTIFSIVAVVLLSIHQF